MTTNTTTTDTYTGKELRGFAEFANCKLAEALHCSEGHIKSYLEQHVIESRALDVKRSVLLAVARLQSVLEQTRPSLDGMFTEGNFVALLNCFQGDIFYPGQIRRIASDLCDDAGVDVDRYETSGIAPLVDKLLDLTAVQQLTLADALEQTWHRGMRRNQTLREFLSELGIELAA